MRALAPGDPDQLGPYRVLALVGAGGMGRVYLGRHASGQVAAVKVLRPELAHETDTRRRFQREAEAARAVRGPGIARVLAVGEEPGRPWIATAFLAGPTLEQAVARHGPLDPHTVRALGAQLAGTLAEVHQAGLVHRDVKPSNVVLTTDGPRLIDFGIARPEHGSTLTGTGPAPASPGYAAPEQVLGRPTGPAADVFALGAVLVYAATGQRAFDGGSVAAVQYRVVHETAELAGVPPRLREPIAGCLAKDASARPAPAHLVKAFSRSAGRRAPAWAHGEVAADIAERVAAVHRLAGPPPDPRPEADGRPDRRRVLALLATGGTAVAVAGTGAAWWLRRGPSGPAAPSWAAEPLADYRPGVAPPALWTRSGTTAGPESSADPETGSGSGAGASQRADAPVPLPVREVVVVATEDGALAGHAVTDGRRRWRLPGVRPIGRPLAAGGRVIVLAAGRTTGTGRLLAVDPADGQRRQGTAGPPSSALLALDEERAYLLTGDGRLSAVDLASWQTAWTVALPVAATPERPPAATASAGHLVLYGTDGQVAGLAAGSGRTVWDHGGLGGSALAPAVAEDRVLLGGEHLRALDLATGEQVWSQPADGTTGWGAPAVEGAAVYAVDFTDLRRCRVADGGGEWTIQLDVEALPLDAPVVQGNSVWAVLHGTGSAGLSVTRADNGIHAWPYARGGAGRWGMAGAGNRVFLLHEDVLVAMPVC